MASSRTYQCLSCRLKGTVIDAPAKAVRRQFSSSKPTEQRKPRYTSIKAEDVGLAESQRRALLARERPYTEREKQLLALKYTPEQMAAIEASEKVFPTGGVVFGRPRGDMMRVKYVDDFSKILPVIDKPVRPPIEDMDPNIRARTQDEIIERLQEMDESIQAKKNAYQARQAAIKRGENVEDWWDGLKGKTLSEEEKRNLIQLDEENLENLETAEWEKVLADPNTFLHSPKGTLNSQSDVLAPEIPKFTTPGLYYPDEDEEPIFARLSLRTGLSLPEIKRLRVKQLVSHRVVNQTRMGKIQSIYHLTIAGDQNGMIGIGEGKAAEPEDASRQAQVNAIRNMKPISRYEDRTIYGEVEGKVGASVVRLSARPPGFGNRCQHLIFEVARAAGIQDLAARTPRSRNPMNVVKATVQALTSQRLPEDIARARGRKLVDVRKVYYGGQVY